MIDTTPDNDTLHGGWGDDHLYGDGGSLRALEDITMVHLNTGDGSVYNDHGLYQAPTEKFPISTNALTIELLVRLDQPLTWPQFLINYSAGSEGHSRNFL